MDRFEKNEDGTLKLSEDGSPIETAEWKTKAEADAKEAAERADAAAIAKFREAEGITDEALEGVKKAAEDKKDKEDPESFAETYPVQAAAFAEQEKKNEALEKSNTQLQKDARTARFREMVMGRDPESDGSKPWLGGFDAHGMMLESLASSFGEDSEQFKVYVSQQKQRAEEGATSAAFSEVGGTGPVRETLTGTDKLEAEAQKLVLESGGKLGFAEVLETLVDADPQAYAEERDAAASGAQ